ncbi:hypothetical protein [Synoicihabitans lomoniglobus]|uniref:Uncharacterized protein n=1 Tax=Synoicihabitans lomoniglobus TaxID=2909285 RepID=A0AAF0I5R2_9BACT|nr:hypothetical protein [Opitutaceae bacterium LMO-M01]WED67498.1 hypothetical protein PXH66_11615 [Opitutaceae bacterium LMO-M01]
MSKLTSAALIAISLLTMGSAFAAERAKVVTFSKTYGGYQHVDDPASPDYGKETFVIAEGQFHLTGEDNDSMTSVAFGELGAIVGSSLRQQGFSPADSEDTADVIIVVHRGRTAPEAERLNSGQELNHTPLAPMAGPVQPVQPGVITINRSSGVTAGPVIVSGGNFEQIARILGFAQRFADLEYDRGNRATDYRYDEIVEELSQPRYYIVLGAYDGRALRANKRKVLLWETRLSFQAEKISFAERYAAMINGAARFFGQNTPAALDRRFVTID